MKTFSLSEIQAQAILDYTDVVLACDIHTRQHTKDLLNVRDAALAIDAPIPLTTQVLEAFKACKCDGHVNDDHCGVIQYWEKLANVTVKRR